jgi:hypothetical protein
MKCPRCWADKAYLCVFRGWREVALGCLAFRPMKCNHCYHHFMVHWVRTIGKRIVPPVLRGTGCASGRVSGCSGPVRRNGDDRDRKAAA